MKSFFIKNSNDANNAKHCYISFTASKPYENNVIAEIHALFNGEMDQVFMSDDKSSTSPSIRFDNRCNEMSDNLNHIVLKSSTLHRSSAYVYALEMNCDKEEAMLLVAEGKFSKGIIRAISCSDLLKKKPDPHTIENPNFDPSIHSENSKKNDGKDDSMESKRCRLL